MGPMPTHVGLGGVLIRLALTIVAGLVIGFNRDQHGKVAGLRTTLLVGLAAAVSMIQVNLLLPTVGKQPDSFITNDLFRLPLGILSGMGFIGGGVILRRENIVIGVTTAATLWFMTVVGLCFGGGQLTLGVLATVVGIVALWGLKHADALILQEHMATLALEATSEGPGESELRRMLALNGLRVRAISIASTGNQRQFSFELRQLRRPAETETPDIVRQLEQTPGITRTEWKTLQ